MAGVAVLSLGAGLLVAPSAAAAPPAPVPAAADRGHGPADNSWPAPSGRPAANGQTSAVRAAQARAKSTGKPVTVDLLTTGNSRTFANPDGTLSTDTSPVPERVKGADGNWRGIDATLKANPDGTLAPTAVPSALTFSGGGSGPMATMTTSDGKKLAVKAPFDLPRPTLNGDSALYRSVLPDVDLELSATELGGWRQVLIVRTAQAAANPKIKKIHLDVTVDGLTVKADDAGNLSAVDATGAPRFTAPSPVLWDSATDPAVAGKPAGKSAAQAAPADGGPATADAAPDAASKPDSNAKGPGDHAKVARIAATASSTGIDLVPDASTLGQGTGPWYVDPGWNPSVDNGAQAWAQVQEYYPETMEYNSTTDNQDKPAAGYCGYINSANPCPATGRTRAYFRVGINSQIWDATILDARLKAPVVASSSPSTSTPMGLYWTGPINQWTRWNAQPCGTGSTMQGCTKIGGVWMAGTGEISYDVLGQMRDAAAQHWGDFTFGFAPDDEYNKYYRQRFSNAPHIVVTYDITPTVWWPQTFPSPGFASPRSSSDCFTAGSVHPWDNPGWVGLNTDITLKTETWSPSHEQLKTTFKIWDDDNGGSAQYFETPWNGEYGAATVSVGPLIDGHQYGWFAATSDGTLGSGTTDMCFLRVDRTPPTASVSSTDFPASGTLNAAPKKFAGEAGRFTFTGTDPVPTNGVRSSGIACGRWTADPVQASATGWTCGDTDSHIKPFVNGVFQDDVTPLHWGTNVVYLQTQDQAGNMSQPVAYTYYAPTDPTGPHPVYGDIDGDKRPDILLPDATGNLRMIGGGSDPGPAPNARPESAPGAVGWANVQISHRGSLGERTVDDLVAHVPGAADLRLYENDSTVGRLDGKSSRQIDKPTACQSPDGTEIDCTAYGFSRTSWAGVTQVIAFGSPTGDTGVQRPGGWALPRTSLLFIENGRLWLGTSVVQGQVDNPATLLSGAGTGWGPYELIAPGPAAGNDQPTVWSRSPQGDVRAYPITNRNFPDYTALADPAAPAKLVTGITPAVYPLIGSAGDIDADTIPDLWGVDLNGQLNSWSGTGSKADAATPFSGPTVTKLATTPTVLGNIGALNTEQTRAAGAGGAFGRPTAVTPVPGSTATSAAGMPGTGDTAYVSLAGGREYIQWHYRATDTWSAVAEIDLTSTAGQKFTNATAVAATFDGTGRLQIASIAGGTLHHQTWTQAGGWTRFDAPPGDSSGASAVAAAGLNNGEAQFMIIRGGVDYHQVRFANNTWSTLNKLGNQGISAVAATATPDGSTQFLSIVNGVEYHQARYSNGTWSAFGRRSGSGVTAVWAAANGDGSTQFLTQSGTTTYWEQRNTDGSWTAQSPLFLNSRGAAIAGFPADTGKSWYGTTRALAVRSG